MSAVGEAPCVVVGDWAELGEHASRVRSEVFVAEQGIDPAIEIDGLDRDSLHCVIFEQDRPIATGRLLPDGRIGRMAVLGTERGRGYGRLVLDSLIRAARTRGDDAVLLHSQAPVVGFYARQGFEPEGEAFEEAGILHLRMRMSLASEGPCAEADADPQPDPGLAEAVGAIELAGAADEPLIVDVIERHETGSDGVGLHIQEWRADPGPTAPIPARGVYLLHGLGEHIGRYDALARWFCARGWRVRGHDHAGHGRSGGRRGVLASERQFVEHARSRIERFADDLGEAPLLLGHSLGGALAAQLVVCERLPVRGLVLSSPALYAGLSPVQRALAQLLYRVAPGMTLGNGLDPGGLSHDATVSHAYLTDPLVHDRVSARLVHWLADAGASALARAGELSVPTLLLVAGADRLVDPEGSREFARRAPRELVTLHWYESMYHEVFNETESWRQAVLADLDRWLRDRMTPGGAPGPG